MPISSPNNKPDECAIDSGVYNPASVHTKIEAEITLAKDVEFRYGEEGVG